MIGIAPFSDQAEHIDYCRAAGVPAEEGALGFKLFDEEDGKVGLIQIKFVSNAAYLLNVCAVDQKISEEGLANALVSVVEFLKNAGVSSVVYPIQFQRDGRIADRCGFDRISETLYVFDLPEGKDGEAE